MDKQDRLGTRGIYFTDVFEVDPETLSDYGAFNVCPWIDMPLFIDPFLLFASEKQEYQQLHDQIIGYLLFLRNHAIESQFLSEGNLRYLYCFKEVSQNCLGFTVDGTGGAGLGPTFGRALHKNLNRLLNNFGEESITDGSHFEKLSLIEPGVGRDKISDLTTNLIKGFLLQYTEIFAVQNVAPRFRKKHSVNKARFDETTGLWHDQIYDLPTIGEKFIMLTPEDILTKDDTWINKEEFKKDFLHIRDSISDIELRDRVTEYFEARLPKRFEKNRYGQLAEKPPTQSDKNDAIQKTLREFPETSITISSKRKKEEEKH